MHSKQNNILIFTGNAIVTIQFPHMRSVAQEDNGYAHQTDSIEKWLKDDRPGDNYTATISSRHSDVLGRHVATLMSISFGRSAAHYEQHFKALISSLDYETFDDLQNNLMVT